MLKLRNSAFSALNATLKKDDFNVVSGSGANNNFKPKLFNCPAQATKTNMKQLLIEALELPEAAHLDVTQNNEV